jgi:uncharacterized HAD superfamily protein
MKYLKFFETFKSNPVIGIDIDSTICDFTTGYNNLYKKYFPDKEPIEADEWYWYKKMDYNGEDPRKWFIKHKAEIFDIAQPYQGAVTTINNIYEYIKTLGFTLNIVTNQPTEESKAAAKEWLDKYGFKYDNIIFSETSKDKWNYVDIMVDDADKVIGVKPLSKVAIKIEQPHNNRDGDFNIPNIKSLTIDLIKHAIEKLKSKIAS